MIDLISTAHAAEEAVVAAEDAGIVGLLGLDWKLFIAQLVNFSIVLLILWKWVFKPVTKALQDRTRKIEKSLADSKKIEQKVADLEIYKQKQIAYANRDYEKIVSKAENIAKQQKEEILMETKLQSEKMIRDAESRIEGQKSQMMRETKEELSGLVIAATEKIISEKLGKDKDKKLIKESLEQI